jgi:high-affinity Fe2+/Pb2+ permease
MLGMIALIMTFLWMLGRVTGFTMEPFNDILIIAVVALLVVILGQEIMINQKLKQVLRHRSQNRNANRGTGH